MGEVFLSLMGKDVRCLWRLPRMKSAVMTFALLGVVVASFAFRRVGYSAADIQGLTPGILWMVFLFTGLVFLNQTALIEEEGGALLGVLTCGADPAVVYVAKVLVSTVFFLLVQLIVLCAHGLFFDPSVFPMMPQLLLVELCVSVAFIALGTLVSSIAVCFAGRELVLPILLFPLVLPLFGAAVSMTRVLMESGVLELSSFWFLVILVYDVFGVVLGSILFDAVVRD